MSSLREQYIRMRNSEKFDARFLYAFFKEKGGRASMGDFMVAMNMYQFTDLWQNLDSEFDVTSVYSKEGKFLKAI